MLEHRQNIANNLVTLRRLTRPAIMSLSNSLSLTCLRLIIETLTEIDRTLDTLDERTQDL